MCECVSAYDCVFMHMYVTHIVARMCILFLFLVESLIAIFGFHPGDQAAFGQIYAKYIISNKREIIRSFMCYMLEKTTHDIYVPDNTKDVMPLPEYLTGHKIKKTNKQKAFSSLSKIKSWSLKKNFLNWRKSLFKVTLDIVKIAQQSEYTCMGFH